MGYVRFREPTSLIKPDLEHWNINDHAEAYRRAKSDIVEYGTHKGLKFVITKDKEPWFSGHHYDTHFIGVELPRYHVHAADGAIPMLFGSLCSLWLPGKIDLVRIMQLPSQHLDIASDKEVFERAAEGQLNTYEPHRTEEGLDFQRSKGVKSKLSCFPANESFFSPPGIFIPSTVAGKSISDARAVTKCVVRKAIKHQE